jgi:microcin C transport system substrate-binding protein
MGAAPAAPFAFFRTNQAARRKVAAQQRAALSAMNRKRRPIRLPERPIEWMFVWEADVKTLVRGRLIGVVGAILLTVACGGGSAPPPGNTGAPSPSSPASGNVSLDRNSYPVFPNADAGADPSVPAEQGGKGFKGEGWETNTDFDLTGDPRAVKGGVLRQAMMTDFPSTLRYYGPNSHAWTAMLNTMVYETLLGLHPASLEYMPGLATHWQVSPDKLTYRFRINPNAKFSDGTPVTADDVLASWKLVVDKGLQDPAITLLFSKFEQPVVESKYIVSVKAKTVDWQNLLQFGNSLIIFPAHVLKNVNGAAFIRDYNYKMLPGSGPYIVHEQDVNKGNSITIKRRTDYWADRERRNIGTSNFDEIQQFVVRDRNLEFERFKRGDIDYYFVQRAQMWVQDLDYPNIKRGLNQKRKIFNNNPQGLQGVAINTRKEPFTDIRVRKGLRHLFNRELMIQKLAFGEYVTMDSIFANSVYENPNNEKIKYDPQRGLQLLAEAGWKDRDANGRLTRNGRPMSLEIVYGDQSSERFFTIFQEDLRKVGITLNLRLVTWETLIKLIDDRAFDMAMLAYTGSVFPNPEVNFHSSLADQNNTNNITGFKNKRADEIMEAYKKEFDLDNRIKLLREFDGIFTNEHHWILEWTAPYERVVFWNKFGYPKGIITRTGDYRDIPSLWWIDAEKSQKLQAAMKDQSVNLGEGASEDRYWLEYAKGEGPAAAAPR